MPSHSSIIETNVPTAPVVGRPRILRATVSGSFRRHMAAIYQAVDTLRTLGVQVLSPSDARVSDAIGDFLFVESDRLRSVKLVEDRHVEAIKASDFLWVVAPDGYTGCATCMEIGVALGAGVPTFSQMPVMDITVGEYVEKVANAADAVARMTKAAPRPLEDSHLLLDPQGATERAIKTMEELKQFVTGQEGDRRGDAERKLAEARHELGRTFGVGRRRRLSANWR